MSGLDLSRLDGVLTIRIDRAEKRNALSLAMREEFATVLLEADADRSVSSVVITGTDPAFCAGVDFGEFGTNRLNPHDRRYRVTPTRALFALRKPVIAAVNGACVSGGLELALACDFILGSDAARFADSHARIGAMPTWGLTAMLPRAIGVRAAKQMSLTGEPIDAATALSLGLVNEIVPHSQLMERAAMVAGLIGQADPGSVLSLLDLYDRGDGASLAEALAFEADAIADRVVDADSVQDAGRAYRGQA
ncbi:MAG TPA: enoyl-CoA hydratase [Acidimicrobiales bacterium]|nr:enoyl-CoA hydratase [Acidimicrobiales bacterium]